MLIPDLVRVLSSEFEKAREAGLIDTYGIEVGGEGPGRRRTVLVSISSRGKRWSERFDDWRTRFGSTPTVRAGAVEMVRAARKESLAV